MGRGETGQSSHGFKLVDSLLGVTLADLPECLVFVPACLNVLGMQNIILGLLGVVPSLGQL